MDCVGTPISNALTGTYSGLPFRELSLAVLLSFASPTVNIDYTTAIRNMQQPLYKNMISQGACQTSNIKLWNTQMTAEFKPKTAFVKKLYALRVQALRDGMTPLSVDEILAEKHALRGEIS